jgi:hypothetical protein
LYKDYFCSAVDMNTIARNLSIFVLMAAAVTTALTTALTIVATTTLAASNTHAHDIQLMGEDDSWVSSFTHTPINWTGNVGSDDSTMDSTLHSMDEVTHTSIMVQQI